MAPCPSDLDWSRWFARELADDRRAQLLAHLDGCEECRAVCAALGSAETATPRTPSTSSERYALQAQIAAGGMGRILRARDLVLDRDVVLKIPHAQPGAQQRFAREIAILARLSHPSIVTVLDAGHLDADTPFLAMPFLAGRTLAAEVASGAQGQRALLAIVPALSAIAYAHSIGIVHRDLKPENLFVGPYGECTVLDWGLAVVVDEDSGDSGGGTDGYAAPEQRAGTSPAPDQDVHALGAVLRFVMTGTHRAGVADRTIPPELRSIIARAMAPSGARYPTAAELMADVQRYLGGGKVLAHTYSVRQRAQAWLRTHRTAAAALGTAIVVAGGIGAWSVWRIVGERDRAVAAEYSSRVAHDRSRRLTTFLLDEVQHSVAELGRLDLAANLLTGLERQVDSAPRPDENSRPEDIIADTVQQQQLRVLAADIAYAKGDFDGALRYLAPTEANLSRLPFTAAMTVELRCEALMRVSDARRGKGDLAGARDALGLCLAQISVVTPEVSTSYPRFDMLHTTASARAALGDLQRDQGEANAALVSYRAGRAALSGATAQTVTGDDRIAVERLVLQAAIESRIGTLASLRVQFADAEASYREALAHAEAAVAHREHEASAQWLVAQIEVGLADIVGHRGRADEKRALIEKAARIAEPLFAIDPTNDEHARWMTILWRDKAESGPPAEAPALFDRILEVSRRRAQLAPRSPLAQRDLGVDLITTADWLAQSEKPGDLKRAQDLCDEGIRVYEQRLQLLAAGSIDSDLASAHVHCAEIAAGRGERALAQRHRQAAIDETRSYATRSEPSMLAWYAMALAAYANDASAADRRAQIPEMNRAWAELRAMGGDEHIATMRELAPWWQPPQEN